MTRDDFQSKNTVIDILLQRGVKIVGSGNARKAMCPLHRDKKPSLSIDVAHNLWYCHAGCGRGSSIDLIMKLEGLTWPAFAEKYEIDTTAKPNSIFHRRTKSSLFGTLKIKPDPAPSETEPEGDAVIEKVYPYHNQFGQEVYQTVRYKPKDFKQRHKENGEWVWNLRGVERVLYRLPEVLKAQEVWLFEGEKDCDNIAELGLCATTSPMGASSWIDGYGDYLKGKDVVLCGDTDDKGKEYIQKVFDSLTGRAKSVRVIELPQGKDVTEYIESFKKKDDAKKALIVLKEQAHNFVRGYRVAVKTIAELQPKYKQLVANKQISSFNLGSWLPELKEIRSLVPGEVVLIVGSTGVGKTALSTNIALAALPMPTLFVELELPDELLYERLVAARHNITCAQVEEEYLKGNDLSDAELEAYFKNLFVCSESVQTMQDIEDQIAHAELKTGVAPKVVVVDYVQLIAGKGERRERIANSAEEIKRVAKRRGVIMIVVSQIGRPIEGKREVGLHDAKEAGELENSSGLVIGVWRDEKDETLLHGRILKNTKGKGGRRFRMNFDGERMIIGPRAPRVEDMVHRR